MASISRGSTQEGEGALRQLHAEAEASPTDGKAQATFLSALTAAEGPGATIALVESGRMIKSPQVLAEYASALGKADALSPAKASEIGALLAQNESAADAFRYSARSKAQQSDPRTGPGSPGFVPNPNAPSPGTSSNPLTGTSTAGGVGLGSRDAPVHVAFPEPSKSGRALRFGLQVLLFGLIGSAVSGLVFGPPGKGGPGSLGKALGGGDEEVEPYDGPTVTFEDVQGVEEAKDDLKEVVAFLKKPSTFSSLGGKLPKGVLLVGSPGTGKTLLARAVAGEAGVPFFYASGSEFDEMYVGVGARRVRALFAAAKAAAPCIVFIDEIDAVGSKRIDRDSRLYHMTLNQLLTELDGFESEAGVVVIAATNTPDRLDSALVRPGRFDRSVVVPLPDLKGRIAILGVHMRDVPVDESVDAEKLARGTPGMSGAELANVVNTAALRAARDARTEVSMADFEAAREKIIMGEAAKSFGYTDGIKKTVAYHEGGHALVALYTPGAVPLHKVSIIPRRSIGALGVTSQLPENDDPNWSKGQLLATLDVCMGGRVAEELVLGPEGVTLGASSDFSRATDVATRMVTQYGMSSVIGPAVVDPRTASPELLAVIESEVARLLRESYDRAKTLLEEKRGELDVLAQALLEEETLDADRVREVVGGRGWW